MISEVGVGEALRGTVRSELTIVIDYAVGVAARNHQIDSRFRHGGIGHGREISARVMVSVDESGGSRTHDDVPRGLRDEVGTATGSGRITIDV